MYAFINGSFSLFTSRFISSQYGEVHIPTIITVRAIIIGTHITNHTPIGGPSKSSGDGIFISFHLFPLTTDRYFLLLC